MLKTFIKKFYFIFLFFLNSFYCSEENKVIISSIPKNKIDIVEDYFNSLVQITTFMTQFNWQEPYKTPEQRLSFSTAFFIDSNGYLITNYHCVAESIVIYLQLPCFGKKRLEARIVAICPARDLALLRLTEDSFNQIKNKLDTTIKPFEFGDSDKVERAEEIMTLGYPLGQEWLKVTVGNVSGIQALNEKQYIQIDAPINPGNSGGPALNKYGKVIGVNTLVINKNGIQNVGYIVPSKEVLIFLNQTENLRKIEFLKTEEDNVSIIDVPLGGILYHGSPEALVLFLNNPLPGGVYIADVIEDSLFYRAGLRKNDMIYKINEYDVDRFGEISVPWMKDKLSLASFLNTMNIENYLEIIVYRNGKKIIIKTKWNIINNLSIKYFYPMYEEIEYVIIGGMVIMPLTMNHIQMYSHLSEDLIPYRKIKNQINGKIGITHVLPNSVAEQARYVNPGMLIKEVNGEEVKSINDLEKSLLKSIKSNFLTLKFDNGEFFVADIKRLLKEESKLSKTYFYNISPVVKTLMNSIF